MKKFIALLTLLSLPLFIKTMEKDLTHAIVTHTLDNNFVEDEEIFLLEDLVYTEQKNILSSVSGNGIPPVIKSDIKEKLLYEACENGSIESFYTLSTELAESGINISEIPSSLNNGLTTIHIAVINDHYPIVEALISLPNTINQQDKEGSTPLYLATLTKNERIVKLLLSSGGDVNRANHQGKTPLHEAVENEFETLVYILLEAGADIDAMDSTGSTPWDEAYKNNNLQIRALLKKKLDEKISKKPKKEIKNENTLYDQKDNNIFLDLPSNRIHEHSPQELQNESELFISTQKSPHDSQESTVNTNKEHSLKCGIIETDDSHRSESLSTTGHCTPLALRAVQASLEANYSTNPYSDKNGSSFYISSNPEGTEIITIDEKGTLLRWSSINGELIDIQSPVNIGLEGVYEPLKEEMSVSIEESLSDNFISYCGSSSIPVNGSQKSDLISLPLESVQSVFPLHNQKPHFPVLPIANPLSSSYHLSNSKSRQHNTPQVHQAYPIMQSAQYQKASLGLAEVTQGKKGLSPSTSWQNRTPQVQYTYPVIQPTEQQSDNLRLAKVAQEKKDLSHSSFGPNGAQLQTTYPIIQPGEKQRACLSLTNVTQGKKGF
ncbi:ankyrin repeat domain-containing protein [Candidatus Dependentiae bacterium]|nr:ankyrin repeat domain-containing protein [Candidatus Dependentiae bacterium]